MAGGCIFFCEKKRMGDGEMEKCRMLGDASLSLKSLLSYMIGIVRSVQ